MDQTVQIGRDGFLVLSNLPPIQVSGHPIGKVEEQLLDILRLDDASASAYLALDTARLITVQVSGMDCLFAGRSAPQSRWPLLL